MFPHRGVPKRKDKAVNAYVIMVDQSNCSLARLEFFELFDIQTKPVCYNLRTRSGLVKTWSKMVKGFQIEFLDGSVVIPLPPLIECQAIPNNRSEILTPSAVLNQLHLSHVAKFIPELGQRAEILLLLGRDVLRAHKFRKQINGPHQAPFAQLLDLGWVVVGEVCLGSTHTPTVSTLKTVILENGHPTVFGRCDKFLQLKEVSPTQRERKAQCSTAQNDKPAPSIEDTLFLEIMRRGMYRDKDNSWVTPLPFREPRQQMLNNRELALSRFLSLKRELQRKPQMQEQYLEFMKDIFANDHAEEAPPLKGQEY